MKKRTSRYNRWVLFFISIYQTRLFAFDISKFKTFEASATSGMVLIQKGFRSGGTLFALGFGQVLRMGAGGKMEFFRGSLIT